MHVFGYIFTTVCYYRCYHERRSIFEFSGRSLYQCHSIQARFGLHWDCIFSKDTLLFVPPILLIYIWRDHRVLSGGLGGGGGIALVDTASSRSQSEHGSYHWFRFVVKSSSEHDGILVVYPLKQLIWVKCIHKYLHFLSDVITHPCPTIISMRAWGCFIVLCRCIHMFIP